MQATETEKSFGEKPDDEEYDAVPGSPGGVMTPELVCVDLGQQIQNLQVHMHVMQAQMGLIKHQVDKVEGEPEALRRKVGVIKEQVAEIEAKPVGDMQIQEIKQQVDSLAERISRIASKPNTRTQSLRTQLDQMADEHSRALQAIDSRHIEQVEAMEAKSDERVQSLLTVVTAQVQRLEKFEHTTGAECATEQKSLLQFCCPNRYCILWVLAFLALLCTSTWLLLFGNVLSKRRVEIQVAQGETQVAESDLKEHRRMTETASSGAREASTWHLPQLVHRNADEMVRATVNSLGETFFSGVLLNRTGYTHVNMKDVEGDAVLYQALRLEHMISAQALLDCGEFTVISGDRDHDKRFHEVRLNLTQGRLGIDVEDCSDALVVGEIHDGPVKEWSRSNPDQAVQQGDRIIAVNGHAGDTLKMLSECEQKKALHMTIERL